MLSIQNTKEKVTNNLVSNTSLKGTKIGIELEAHLHLNYIQKTTHHFISSRLYVLRLPFS